MSGTDLAYHATSANGHTTTVVGLAEAGALVGCPICLRCAYTMSGTEVPYGCVVLCAYATHTRCP
eukprot:10804-Rhodomonas_salina.1